MLEGERTDRTQVIAEVYISGWSNNGPKPYLRRAERALLSTIGYASNE